MAAPQVNWRTQNNASNLPNWDIGTIDAGTASPDQGVLIWNNFAGSSNLSTMTNCTITTKDSNGGSGDNVPLVYEEWIKVRVDSAGEIERTGVGDLKTHPIQAGGNTVNANGTFSPGIQEILGVANDGTMNAKGNFAEVTLRAEVPTNATAGNVAFLTRVAYQYV